MGHCSLRAGRAPTGFEDENRLVARRDAAGRHELPRFDDALDIKQDGVGQLVEGEIVEEIAEIDINHVADRNHVREAETPRSGPVDGGGHQRP